MVAYKVEIPNIVSDFFSRSNPQNNNYQTENYCINWIKDFSIYRTVADSCLDCINSCLEAMDQEDKIRVSRFSIFFNMAEMKEMTKEMTEMTEMTETEKRKDQSTGKLKPETNETKWRQNEIKLSPIHVTNNVYVLHISWRHYEYVIRKLKEIRDHFDLKAANMNPCKIIENLLDFNRLYFDHAFFVNLERRNDRRERIEMIQELKMSPFAISIFKAVDAIEEVSDALLYEDYQEHAHNTIREKGIYHLLHDCNPHNKFFVKHPRRYGCQILSEGAFGIYMSYLKLFRMSIDANWPYLAVFEDDVCFHKHFSREWPKICKLLPANWNVIYLGSKNYHPPIESTVGYHHVNEYTTGAHAMLFRSDALCILEPFLKENPYLPIDEIIKLAAMKFEGSLNMFVLDPPLVITLCAEDSESDIQSHVKHMNETYEFFFWKKESYYI